MRKGYSRELDKVIKHIEEHLAVVAAILFGSWAKGMAKPLSDVDVAVVLKDITPEIEADIGSFYSDKLDIVLFHRLPLYIQFEVLKHGKEMFCKDQEFLLEVKRRVLRDYLETSWIYRRAALQIAKHRMDAGGLEGRVEAREDPGYSTPTS